MPGEINMAYRLGTAPSGSAKDECMYMWNELPTNDRTHEWNICEATCHACDDPLETNEHWLHECITYGAVRRIASARYPAVVRTGTCHQACAGRRHVRPSYHTGGTEITILLALDARGHVTVALTSSGLTA